MTYTRTNVYENGGDFSNPTILWYARGVAAMQARALADPTSWRFYAAIHGIDRRLWTHYGYLSPSDQMPAQDQIDLFWNQCQHGTWYFLPWHRGYLLALEATIREVVTGLGGPSNWALPYWNYFAPDEFKLPPAFASPDWPDGKGNNPLFIKQRWGPKNNGDVYVPLDQVNLDALNEPEFTGVASGGSPGFGGVDTGFEHNGSPHGLLENQPHDMVHVFVGGRNPANRVLPGLMSYPPTAGLDPIFYLHHANIDRLWEVWVREPTSLGNPTEAQWVNGPASIGGHPFVMPNPPKGTPWYYTPGDVADLANLDYVYDNMSPAGVTAAVAERLERLHLAAGAAMEGAARMATTRHNVELVGAHDQELRIAGSAEVRATVRLDAPAHRRMTANLAAAAPEMAPAAAPDRVFLNLEKVRSLSDATVLQVYVNVPDGANPADYPERWAGNVGLFGASQATAADGEHGGAGLTFVLEITHVVNTLHLQNELDALEVRIVPFDEVPEEAEVRVGRVSVFRQGR
ncbi:MAG TPA: tyrosinase family protein [Longimicrobiaceae bacterium]|nr:tyrosinase family protein [Longimicrobiaceae bacterium]